MSRKDEKEINYMDIIKNYDSKKKDAINQRRITENSINPRESRKAAPPENPRRTSTNPNEYFNSFRRDTGNSVETSYSFSRTIADDSLAEDALRERKKFEKSSLMGLSHEVNEANKRSNKEKEEFHQKFEKDVKKTAKEFEFQEEKGIKLCFKISFYLLISLVLSVLATFILQQINRSKITYCDNMVRDSPDCTNCPPIAICKGGSIVKCASNLYRLSGGKCVYSKEDESREIKFAHELINDLARRRGDFECDSSINFKMSKSEVESYFKRKFTEKGWDFRDTYRWMQKFSGEEFSAMGLIVEKMPNFEIYSDTPSPSLQCAIKLYYRKNKVIVIGILSSILILCYILFRLKSMLNLFDKARDAFEESISILKETPNKELAKKFVVVKLIERKMIQKHEEDVIMDYFELIRENDERMGVGIMEVNGIRDYYYFLY